MPHGVTFLPSKSFISCRFGVASTTHFFFQTQKIGKVHSPNKRRISEAFSFFLFSLLFSRGLLFFRQRKEKRFEETSHGYKNQVVEDKEDAKKGKLMLQAMQAQAGVSDGSNMYSATNVPEPPPPPSAHSLLNKIVSSFYFFLLYGPCLTYIPSVLPNPATPVPRLLGHFCQRCWKEAVSAVFSSFPPPLR